MLLAYGVCDVLVHPYINMDTEPRVSEHGKPIYDKVQEIHVYFG